MKIIFSVFLGVGLAAGAAQAQEKNISIGTGGVTGVYFPTGVAICNLVNKTIAEHGFHCAAEATGGSIYNIDALRAGGLDFGVVQSDWQFHAYNGSSKFKKLGRFEGLRAVFSVHPEPVTIIARKDAGVSNITDLKGKRLNIGNPGSGTRGTWEVIENALGWERSDLKLAAELESNEMAQAVCDNKIDAYFWLIGHPSAQTQESLATCATVLVSAKGDTIDKLVQGNSFYRKAVIPAGMYGDNLEISTFGVGATFVTSENVPEDMVHAVVKAVFENLEEFREQHPAFAGLKEEEMIRDSLTAPLHDGARKYYVERGWMHAASNFLKK